jgi:hypothetical protein
MARVIQNLYIEINQPMKQKIQQRKKLDIELKDLLIHFPKWRYNKLRLVKGKKYRG